MTAAFLNPAQKKCIESYANGEFGHLLQCADEQEFKTALASCGDGLFIFMVRELATSEDCDSVACAVQRMERLVAEVQSVQQGVETLPEEERWA